MLEARKDWNLLAVAVATGVTAELVRMGWLHPLLTLFLPDSGTLDRPFPVSHCPKYQLSPEMPSQIHPEVRSTNFLHLILTISVLGTNIPK